MASVPVTASGYEFTPDCLKDDDNPPVFVLRHTRRRYRNALRDMAIREGLRTHSTEKIRQVSLAEIERGWQGEAMPQTIATVRSYYAACDDLDQRFSDWREECRALRAKAEADGETLADEALPAEPVIDFDKDDTARVEALLDEVSAISEKLRNMAADVYSYNSSIPNMMLRILLISTSLDVRIERQRGVLTDDCAEDVFEALAQWCADHGHDDITAELANAELLTETIKGLAMGEVTRKN